MEKNLIKKYLVKAKQIFTVNNETRQIKIKLNETIKSKYIN